MTRSKAPEDTSTGNVCAPADILQRATNRHALLHVDASADSDAFKRRSHVKAKPCRFRSSNERARFGAEALRLQAQLVALSSEVD